MRVYYNEIDAFAASWLRGLIAAGHLPAGDVDERSIRDVRPADLEGYTQCHLFAGIGGWPLALQLAGWGDREVWTGSCPCQPFSAAGQRGGFDDERHLWPEFFRLIRERRPPVVFGEQVSGPAGRTWLDLVSTDLEGVDYAVGALDSPACSVGAPHIRQRLWWVANAQQRGREGRGLASAASETSVAATNGSVVDAASQQVGFPRRAREPRGSVGHALGAGLEEQPRREQRRSRQPGSIVRREGPPGGSGPWDDVEWLPCLDGKRRPTQPGLQPLAHGVPGRVGLLRGYGNAIVPALAAEFVAAYMDVTG